MIETVLTAHQKVVMDRVIAQEEAHRHHLVIALSGAHAYGFPSPDSDLDLKSVHIDPTARLLGLTPGAPHADRMEIIEEVEIDYTSNELKPVLLGVLQGNGNYIERFLGALLPLQAPELSALKGLVQGALSRRLFGHYRGFATSQLKAFQADGGGSAKKLLYVLRTALTGTHLLRTGELEADLTRLLDDYSFGDARVLVQAKRAGERTAADPALLDTWRPRLATALQGLDAALAKSTLPVDPPNEAELEAWLVETRRSRLA